MVGSVRICAKWRHLVKKHTYHFGILFSHSGRSAFIETVFSIKNALWTDEKNSFLVETIKAMIVTKTHFRDLSHDFYTLILNKPKLLREIRSSRKYGTSALKEEPTTSTSDGN
jgi:hypothetical protein